VQQQIAEITRIASQTSFNGLNVLDGSSGDHVPGGRQCRQHHFHQLVARCARRSDRQVATSTGTAVTATALNGSNLTVQVGNGVACGGRGVAAPARRIGQHGLPCRLTNPSGACGEPLLLEALGERFSNITGGSAGTTYGLTINGVAIYAAGTAIASGQVLTGSNVATQINLYSSQTGVTAALSATGALQLTASDGRDIAQTETVVAGTGGTGTGAGIAAATTQGTITLSAASNIVIGGAGAADIGFTAGSISLGNATLANANVLTVKGANSTIAAIDSALATVSGFQSQLGAIQNRFTSTVSNLQATSQNLTASRSTIQDADFAAETANLTKSQVLQQAGISVLAQANQEPQLILKLLQ
jgi:flagellin